MTASGYGTNLPHLTPRSPNPTNPLPPSQNKLLTTLPAALHCPPSPATYRGGFDERPGGRQTGGGWSHRPGFGSGKLPGATTVTNPILLPRRDLKSRRGVASRTTGQPVAATRRALGVSPSQTSEAPGALRPWALYCPRPAKPEAARLSETSARAKIRRTSFYQPHNVRTCHPASPTQRATSPR